MSRVGKMPIKVESGVKVQIAGQAIKTEGPKGKLSFDLPEGVKVRMDGDQIVVEKVPGADNAAALFGTIRSVIANMVHGVSQGFTRELDINGVGYRAAVKGQTLSLTLGFSHPIDFELPQGVSARVDKNTHLVLTGADKVVLGMVAAKIRGFRKPEPYQGKGVKYTEERIIRKQGKSAGAK